MELRRGRLLIPGLFCLLVFSMDAQSAETGHGIINVNVANVREGAGTQHPVIGQMRRNEGVMILGQRGSWYEIRSTDGRLTGFVQFRLVRPMGGAGGNPSDTREVPRFQFSPTIAIDDQYVLQNYAMQVEEALKSKIRNLTRGVEGRVDFDGADFGSLGYAFWDTDAFQMFELVVPFTEDSFLKPSKVQRVGTGYVIESETGALIKNLVQLVQESYLAAEESFDPGDNNVFLARRYAALTQVSYVSRNGRQLAFLRPFDVSMTYFAQTFHVFYSDYEDSINLNPDGDTIQFTTEVGNNLIEEFFKRPYPSGTKLH